MENPNQIITYYLVAYQYYEFGKLTRAGWVEVGLGQRWKPFASKKIMALIADHLGVDPEKLLPISIQELGTYPRSLIGDLQSQAETLTVTPVKRLINDSSKGEKS